MERRSNSYNDYLMAGTVDSHRGVRDTTLRARSINRLHLLVLFGYFGVSALFWARLPAQLPTHFDWNGEVTTWSPTTWLSWFGLPLISAGTALLIHGCMRLSKRAPYLWNVPEKQRFLRLSPEQRAPIIARLEVIGAFSGLMTTFLFVGIHVGVLQVAAGRATSLPWYSQVVGGIAILLIFLVAIREARWAGGEIRRISND